MRLSCLVLLFACVSAGTAVAAEKPDDDAPIASRGTASVSYRDIDARMARVPERDRAATIGDPQRLEMIVSGVLLTRQLANEARKNGLDKDPNVAREIELAIEGTLARNELDRVSREAKVDSVALAREVYQADRARFSTPEHRVARHLLISTEKHTKDEARTIADQALADARKPGADFAEVARKYSEDDTTRPGGGLLPPFGRNVMETMFEQAAFALEPGQISDVIETRYGFHVIKLDEIVAAKPKAFEEVRAELELELAEQHRKRAAENHADTLRNLPVEAEPEAIAALRSRYDHLIENEPGAHKLEDLAPPTPSAEPTGDVPHND